MCPTHAHLDIFCRRIVPWDPFCCFFERGARGRGGIKIVRVRILNSWNASEIHALLCPLLMLRWMLLLFLLFLLFLGPARTPHFKHTRFWLQGLNWFLEIVVETVWGVRGFGILLGLAGGRTEGEGAEAAENAAQEHSHLGAKYCRIGGHSSVSEPDSVEGPVVSRFNEGSGQSKREGQFSGLLMSSPTAPKSHPTMYGCPLS